MDFYMRLIRIFISTLEGASCFTALIAKHDDEKCANLRYCETAKM